MLPVGPDRPFPSDQEIKPARLLALLDHAPAPGSAAVALEFQALHRLVESLPLTSGEFCLAHNWLVSAHRLCQAGETNAARYQVALIVRRLAL